MDCIFCKIVNKSLDSKILLENDHVLAFPDLMPQAPTHVLIIPRKHIASLNEISADDSEILSQMLLAAKQLAHDLQIAETGYRLVTNCGAHANQTVPHLHLHLLGGRPMSWPPG